MKRGAFCSARKGDLVVQSGPLEMTCRLCSWRVFLNCSWAAAVVLSWVPAGSSYVSPGTTGDSAACRDSSLCCHGGSFPLCSRFLLQFFLRFSLIRASREALLVGLCSEYLGRYFSDSKLLAAGVKYSPVTGVWAVQKSVLLLYSCDLQAVLKRPGLLSLSVCTTTTKHECTRASFKKVWVLVSV